MSGLFYLGWCLPGSMMVTRSWNVGARGGQLKKKESKMVFARNWEDGKRVKGNNGLMDTEYHFGR